MSSFFFLTLVFCLVNSVETICVVCMCYNHINVNI